jgi:hypothetical protein
LKAADLAGAWRLVSCEHRRTSDGAVEHPFGPNPKGRLIYLADGLMSVILVDPARPRFESGLFEAKDAEHAAASRGCVAYTGRWSLREGRVEHDVDVSLFPNWMGTKLVRECRLEGQKLILSTTQFAIAGVAYTARLIWERE